mmetsp:Transcript_5027/g.9697  ORF Transcript_5027/g.9697 Transcript_5027/m.9697 type:complete len:113 (+) Transcript_5027:147-485(+)
MEPPPPCTQDGKEYGLQLLLPAQKPEGIIDEQVTEMGFSYTKHGDLQGAFQIVKAGTKVDLVLDNGFKLAENGIPKGMMHAGVLFHGPEQTFKCPNGCVYKFCLMHRGRVIT